MTLGESPSVITMPGQLGVFPPGSRHRRAHGGAANHGACVPQRRDGTIQKPFSRTDRGYCGRHHVSTAAGEKP